MGIFCGMSPVHAWVLEKLINLTESWPTRLFAIAATYDNKYFKSKNRAKTTERRKWEYQLVLIIVKYRLLQELLYFGTVLSVTA